MKNFLSQLFKIEKKPKKGLLAAEWVVMIYIIVTTLIILFTFTKIHTPQAIIWGRIRIIIVTVALWGVYRMAPCRFLRFARIATQMALLGWWYPDTYEINRIFPNLDYIFADMEQSYFGCQPALLFCHKISNPIFSEMMDLGYASYYPMIIVVTLYYFIWKYKVFEQATFIILASFFIYYIVYVFLPVAGPQFYYKIAGLDNIAHGIFPNVGDYFNNHQDVLKSPGYTDGLFYQLVEDAKNAGERPTAAFPSSHVGISTLLMILAWKGNRKLFLFILPFYILLCFSTVYIQAHYLIDAIAGFLSAIILYFATKLIYDRCCN